MGSVSRVSPLIERFLDDMKEGLLPRSFESLKEKIRKIRSIFRFSLNKLGT